MVNCKSVEEQLSAFMDGEASREDCEAIEQHLQTCGDCRRLLSHLQGISGALQAAYNDVTPPVGLELSILRAVEMSREGVQARRLSALYVVCAALALLGVATALLSPLGVAMKAFFRFDVSIIGGIIHLSPDMGSSWIAGIAISCILLAGFSIFGVALALRTSRTEGIL